MLAIRVIALWAAVGPLIGFGWGTILELSDAYNAGLASFYGLVGLLQGIIGGLYHAGIVGMQKPKGKWLTLDWLRNGFIAAVPFFAFYLWMTSKGKGGFEWDTWFVPVQALFCSYLTAGLVNKEMEAIGASLAV
jgi:hypothetical protein